jgi:hypothetical protein
MRLLHAEFPGVSIYFNSKPTGDVAGTVCRSIDRLPRAVLEDAGSTGKAQIDYKPRGDDEAQAAELEQIVSALFRWANTSSASDEHNPGYQLVIAEAAAFDRGKTTWDPVQEVAQEGREPGIRLLAGYQYPTALSTPTRDQLQTLAVHGVGRVGQKTVSSDGFYPESIIPWVNEGYQWALYTTDAGWAFRNPLRPAGDGSTAKHIGR